TVHRHRAVKDEFLDPFLGHGLEDMPRSVFIDLEILLTGDAEIVMFGGQTDNQINPGHGLGEIIRTHYVALKVLIIAASNSRRRKIHACYGMALLLQGLGHETAYESFTAYY